MKPHKILFLFICLFLVLGFRTFNNKNKWSTSNDSAAKRKLFVDYSNGTRSVSNDLNAGDILAGATLTVETLMDSIFDDYNNINASYLELVDTDDDDYDAEKSGRTITITFGGAGGANAGEARLKTSGGSYSGCDITLEESLLDSAKDLVGVITHEIGHCVGLDHPQDNVRAVMSYFSDPEDLRLLVDDKMGVIFLFPKDKAAGEEDITWGLGCSKR